MRKTDGMFDGHIPNVRCGAYLAGSERRCLLVEGHDGDHTFAGALYESGSTCPDTIPAWMEEE